MIPVADVQRSRAGELVRPSICFDCQDEHLLQRQRRLARSSAAVPPPLGAAHACCNACVGAGPDSMGRTVGCGLLYVVRTAFGPRVVDRSVAARNTRREKRPKKSRRRRLCSHWSPINNSRHNLLSTPLSTTPYTNMNTILPSTLSPSARWSYHVRWSLRLVYSVRRGNRLRHHTRAPPLPPPPGPAFAGPSKKAAHIEIHTR